MDDQTRSDLEKLATKVQDQWTRVNCMQVCMNNNHLTEGMSMLDTAGYMRNESVRQGMGFRTPVEMFDWNDEPGRTKDQVLERIKDALNS